MNLPFTRKGGGANRSNKFLAEALVKKGVEVLVVGPAFEPNEPHMGERLCSELVQENIEFQHNEDFLKFYVLGINVIAVFKPVDLRVILQQAVQSFKPNWILVSSEDPSQTLFKTVYELSPDNIIYLVHTQYMLPFGPLSLYPGTKRTELIKKAKAVVSIGAYVADYIHKYSGIQTFINHPPHYGNDFKYLGGRENKYILLINPSLVKGISILLELAKELPARQFLVVPGWGTTSSDLEKIRSHKNIYIREKTDDLDQLFADVSILLMPSLWHEPFGMSVVDAMARGIPVIASNTGGLQEAKLGTNYQIPVVPVLKFSGRFDDNYFPIPDLPAQDINPWKTAIEQILKDENTYETEAKLSYWQAADFISSLSVDPFISFLNSLNKSAKSAFENLSAEQKNLLLARLKTKRTLRAQHTQIQELEKRQYYNVSPQQNQLLYIDEIENGFYGFTIGNIIKLDGQVDVSILERIFSYLFDRHEAFRTHFCKVDGVFKLRVNDSARFKMDYIDLSEQADKLANAKNHVSEIINSRFDVSIAPLLKICILRYDSETTYFIFSMHHLICDGESINILSEEISLLYKQLISGTKLNSGNRFPYQYKDFSVWQRRMAADNTKGRDYWLGKLKAPLPYLEIATDYPRPAKKSFAGSTIRGSLTHGQNRSLKEIGEASGSGMFIVLLSLVQILLYKYSGQDDIIVGVPASIRKRSELNRQIGFYVNMIACRVRVDSNNTFLDFVNLVKAGILDDYEHEEYPYETLIEELDIPRDISRSPLFDVMVSMNYNSGSSDSSERSQNNLNSINPGIDVGSSHDLAFLFSESNGEITLSITYNVVLFKEKRIETMLEHFFTCIKNVIVNPSVQLGDIAFITRAEEKRILEEFNQPYVDFPKSLLIHEQFEKNSVLFPDSVAVVHDLEHVTYSELNSRANRVARKLLSNNIQTNDVVGIIATRSVDTIVAMLAILKAGAVYLPLDTSLPGERLNYILKTSGCKIITISDLSYDLTRLDIPITHCWINSDAIESFSNQSLDYINKADDAAYIIYTSGSTGNPKGVIIRHFSVIRLLINDSNIFNFSSKDRWSLFHSFGFDFSVWELYGALFFGATVVIAPEETTKDISLFRDLIKEECITVLNQVPGVFYALDESDRKYAVGNYALRYIIFGGDVLHPGKLKKWKLRYPDICLVNMYGITETTVHVTYKHITMQDIENNLSNIGKPIPTLKVFILDEKRKILPVGVVGEICVSGYGLSSGYKNDTVLSEKKFIPNPYIEGEFMYCSGDSGRYLENGDVEYIARIDNQVKVRGFRIEVGEVEVRIGEIDFVRDVVVVALRDSEETNYLVAYIVPQSESNFDIIVIRDHLAKYLPYYMIPSFFVPISTIPLTHNGKVDRKALPTPTAFTANSNLQAPGNDMETRLQQIWMQVLNIRDIGVHQNFFEIGGHSLKAIKVAGLVHHEFNIQIRLGVFFEMPTIAELAKYILSLETQGSDEDTGLKNDEIEIYI